MKIRSTIISLALAIAFLSGCGAGSDRTYEYPAGYRVTLYLMGGEFSDGTSDRVHGGIMQPTAMKNVPNLIHGEPYLNYDKPFAVWNTDPYGYGTDYTDDTIIDSHVTLYAIYGRYIYDETSLLEIECGNPSAVYVLANDITTTSPWTPLCQDSTNPFKGKIYGKGFSITYSTVSSGSRIPDISGLFAYTAGANIGDLYINAKTTGKEAAGGIVGVADATTFNKVRIKGNVTGNKYVGGIVGKITGDSKVINSSFGDMQNSGTITGLLSSASAGGLVGYMSDGKIENSSSRSDIYAYANNSSAGGMVGYAINTDVRNCLHWGHIKAQDGERMMAGGIAGRITDSSVSLCYTETTVEAPEKTDETSAGGIVGSMESSEVSHSLAQGLLVVGQTAGRIVGTYTGSLESNYARNDLMVNYDVTEDGENNGTGISHSILRKSQDFYANTLGMDFRLYWTYPENHLYPRLEWEEVPEFTKIYTADELYNIRDDMDGWYIIMKDIDLSDFGSWKSIGSVLDQFMGVIDGNGKTISNMKGTFFGYCSSITVYDLNMTNVTGGLVSTAGNSRLDRISITGEGAVADRMNPGYVSYVTFDGKGRLIGSIDNGMLFYSYSTGTTPSASDYSGGLLGIGKNIIAANNYTLMDVYSRTGGDSNAGGAFGALENSLVNKVYSYGKVLANSNNTSESATAVIKAAAGGFVGSSADSDIRNSAAFGDSVYADYYDINGTFGAESYAGRFAGISDNTIFRNVFSNRNADVSADYTSGEAGELIETDIIDEDFFTLYMGLDFSKVWRMPVQGDLRTFPVFKWNRDLTTPGVDDEWYWYGIRKYYEEF